MSSPYDDETYTSDVSDSSDSETDEEMVVKGKDEPEGVVLKTSESDECGKEVEAEVPYGLDEEEDDGLHAFSEDDTPIERSMKQKKQRHRDKFATW